MNNETCPVLVEPLESRLLNALAGDATLDNVVDLRDFTALAANFNGTGKTWSQGDFNGDSAVDLTDFTILARHFGETFDPPPYDYDVLPGQRIQPVIDAHPGTRIHVEAGTFSETLDVHGVDLVLDPATIITNYGRPLAAKVNNATVTGGIFRGCANGLLNYQAAVQVFSNAMITDTIVERTDSTGVCVLGHDDTLLRVTSQDNGQAGIGGDHCANVLVKDCFTQRNNRGLVAPVWAGQGPQNGYVTAVLRSGLWQVNPDWEAGGGKWWATDHVTIEHLQAYDNVGPGIWFDYRSTNAVVRACTVTGNGGWQPWFATGIRIELQDQGPFLLEDNTISGEVGGNISVEQARNVTIRNNTLTGGIGVLFRDYDRGAQYRVANVEVTGNAFIGCGVTWWEKPYGTGGASVHDNLFQ